MTQTLDSFFSGGGGKSLSWKDVPIGTVYQGTIIGMGEPQQATDPATGNPAFTRQGKPRVQVRVDLQTDYRDPTDPEDDGRRSLYVGGWMTGAVGDAMRKAGVSGGPPQVGATLGVRLIEREENGKGVNPTNKFDAYYIPGAPAATQDFFNAAPQGPAAPAAQPAALPPMAPPAPVPNISGQGYAVPPQPQFQQPVAPPQQFQQPVPQQAPPQGFPPAAQQPAQQPLPAALGSMVAKPDALTQEAWDQLPDAAKAQVAQVYGNVIQQPQSAEPPF